eukprot:gnl/Hemi2/17532_TR5794_c0_g1_i1.p1 gnl/Hemi2/17532_TR5794_c0_g1~~gnl/Hemi2/17532_TR5794_c0_g1_i1.p1  ORF type:complete len:307 (+),score=96.20 gnl/Hemi2/17532_TR5794_c0_g1_i1:91-1011(+)
MGGGYYDRSMAPASAPAATTSWGGEAAYSVAAAEVLASQQSLHPQCDPKNRSLTCANQNPVICCVDVTGSMGDWAKIIFDKLPMFYGQIMLQGYLTDPAISFCAVGDASRGCGEAPLQITEFASGTALDAELGRLWLRGGMDGGGNLHESYELAAYFYAKKCTFSNVAPRSKPFLFLTGDEAYYDMVKAEQVQRILGDTIPADASTAQIFEELRARFHVFHIHKAYADANWDAQAVAGWERVVGAERVLKLTDPKAVVDVMLGAIAVVSGARSLDRYFGDMRGRGQTDARVNEVQHALERLHMPPQ